MNRKRLFLALGILALAAVLAVALMVRGSKGSLEKAERFYDEGDFVRALIEFQAVLQQDPKTLPALEKVARIWLMRGNPLEARRYLNAALHLAPDDLTLRRLRADALYQLRQGAPLRAEALAILEAAPADQDALLHLARTSGTDAQVEEVTKRLETFDSTGNATVHLVRGLLALRNQELDEAQASLEKAVSLDSNSVAAHEALANLHFLKGEKERGAEAFARAAQLAPARSLTRVKHASSLARSGQIDEAIAKLEEILAEASDYFPASTSLANLLSRQGKHAEAHKQLEAVFTLHPRNIGALATKTQLLVAEGKLDEAIESFRKLDASYPEMPQIRFDLARLYLRSGRVPEAQATLREALNDFPEFTEADLLLADLNLRTGQDKTATIERLQKLVKRLPNLLQAQLLLSNAYQSQGSYEEAAKLFRDQLAKNPDQSGPHYALGMINLRQKKTAQARQSFEAAQKAAPDDQRITSRLVELDLADKDFAAAHLRVKVHLEKEETPWGTHFLEARIYMAEKKWAEAEAQLGSALKLNDKSIAIYNALIDCYLATEKASEAIKTVKDVLKDNPKSLPHHIILARLLEEEKSYQEAADSYLTALDLSPDFVPALNNLAYLYTEYLPDLDKALTLARKARDLQPDPASISDTLGWIHFKRGEFAQAGPLLEEAAQNSDHPEISYHVGMARLMDGKQDLAVEALTKAVASEMEFSGKEDARKQLAALGGEQNEEQLMARVEANPKDVIARIKLGQLFAKAGKNDKARASYEEALKINNDSVDALIGLAMLYAGPLDDLEKAATFAERARPLAENDPRIAAVLGRVSLRKKDYKLAAGRLEAAVRTIKDDAALQRDFGIAAYHVGRVRDATTALQRVTALAPDSPESRDAEDFLGLITPPPKGDWTMLSAPAEKVLQADPDHVPALMIRAAVHRAEGDRPAAIAIYEAIQARLSEFTPAQKELVSLLSADPATLDRAYSLGLKVHAALPNNSDPVFTRLLGVISYRAGKAQIAIQFLKDTISPPDSEGHFYLGMAYLKSDEREKGEEQLRSALKGDLAEELAKQAKAALDGDKEQDN